MKILLLTIFFSTSCLEIPEQNNLQPAATSGETIQIIGRTVADKALYFGAAIVLGSASFLTRIGWGLCLLSPWSSTIGNECLLFSNLCGSAAQHALTQLFEVPFFNKVLPSQTSWHTNQTLLSQTPAFSDEEKKLLQFLEKRWLAKSTGFFSTMIDWVCPCFGVTVQVHPETSHSYARSPSIGFSHTYKNRMEAWKQSLPHPQNFPLILTRPFNLQDYLPSYMNVPLDEKVQTTVARAALKIEAADSKVIVDLTHIFPDDPKKWLETWAACQDQLAQACEKQNLNPRQILCIQRLRQEEIGGIRLLPWAAASAEEIDRHHRFLEDWISNFGLSANRVELDRCPLSARPRLECRSSLFKLSREEFFSGLKSFEQNWKSGNPQKSLMVKGAVQVLKGLFAALSEDKWNEVINCPTRSSVVQTSFLRIKEQLNFLAKQDDDVSFFDTALHVEQIHANLMSLLEILAPFTSDDFPAIYRDLLISIPLDLKPLASYGIHASGMTSLAGIFKAVEKTLGKTPRVLYGENTYYECINAAHRISKASPIEDATENDWKEVDLIIAQFNPVLKRVDLPNTEYRVERVAETLHKSLNARQEKPLTLALDCTLDFIDSPRVARLLAEFQDEIEKGRLNIVCYRSGLKYDLFGMDNYCGAPFYMIHNQDPKWAFFDSLLTEPLLQTDRLSLNWFCLAYQNTAPQLELYRKQIFDNTRALLKKVPSRLLNSNAVYRIIPAEEGADLGFIDIKISGPLHQLRGSAIAGGCLYLKCMEGKQPIFYRPSLGLYHPNFTMIFSEDRSTIRLTLGLDPAQIDLLAECFEMIDTLNGSPWENLLDKLNISAAESSF